MYQTFDEQNIGNFDTRNLLSGTILTLKEGRTVTVQSVVNEGSGSNLTLSNRDVFSFSKIEDYIKSGKIVSLAVPESSVKEVHSSVEEVIAPKLRSTNTVPDDIKIIFTKLHILKGLPEDGKQTLILELIKLINPLESAPLDDALNDLKNNGKLSDDTIEALNNLSF